MLVKQARWLWLCSLVLFLGCGQAAGPAQDYYVFSGAAMGTRYNIKLLPPQTGVEKTELLDALAQDIEHLITDIDNKMSTYKQDSEISRFNRAAVGEPFVVSDDSFEVISLAQQISFLTNGAFDITVAPLVRRWGFGAPPPDSEPLDEPTIPSEDELDSLKQLVDFRHLELDLAQSSIVKQSPLEIDLSAIAKGYAVDKVADYLDSLQVSSYLVEIGGELRTRGTNPGGQPWRIGIEKPAPGSGITESRSVQQAINVSGVGVATSGDYRNYRQVGGETYSHTIDPKTAQPIKHRLHSVTVIATNAAEADALATALNVMGPTRAYEFAVKQKLSAYFIMDGQEGLETRYTPEFAAYLRLGGK